MKHENVDARMMDLHRRIALVLRKEPGLVHYLAKQLRSKIATARTSEKASDNHWEWYVILTLWPPLDIIRLLEDPSEQAARLRRTSPFVSLLSMPNQPRTTPDPE